MKPTLIVVFMLMAAEAALADLTPGEALPDQTLTAPDGKTRVALSELTKKVTVIHLWKCN